MPLAPGERAALDALVDTLLPATPEIEGLGSAGTALGVPERFEEALATALSPRQADGFRRLLRLLDAPATGAVLGGRPKRFAELSPQQRERFLLRLADAPLAGLRQAFTGPKRLLSFLYYTDERTWPAIGYARPPADAEPPAAAPVLPPWNGEAVDVVVVGSGAGGGVAAAVLARAGWRVLVIEQAPLRGPADFNGREADGWRDLYEGAGAATSRDGAIGILAGRAVGGGTTVNWMTSLEPPPWLRAEWAAAGVDGADGPGFDDHVRAVLERAHVTLDESDLNGPNRVLADGARACGLLQGEDWRRVPRNAEGCRSRCGFCVFGCPWSAKRGTLVTWLADAAAAGTRFGFGTGVARVLHDGGRVTGVQLDDGSQIRARTVVAAGGSLHTAALLLRSGLRSRGLGRLFIHPTTSVAAVMPGPVEMWRGPMQTVVVDRYADLDGAHNGVLFEAVPGHPGQCAAALPWRSGAGAKRDMLRIARTAALLVLARDQRPGRVSTDRRGAPRVEYRVSRPDAERLVFGLVELSRLARAAGAIGLITLHTRGVRVEAGGDGRIGGAAFDAYAAAVERAGARPHGLGLFTAHQMGSCALGRDGEAPADGATARVWDLEGLYVMDASAFPSPSGVNPMISIQALAHRNASRLARPGPAGGA